jgi:hypothetical protein
MPRVEIPVYPQQFPILQLLFDVSAHALGLQPERLYAEIDALAAIGRARDVEAIAVA